MRKKRRCNSPTHQCHSSQSSLSSQSSQSSQSSLCARGHARVSTAFFFWRIIDDSIPRALGLGIAKWSYATYYVDHGRSRYTRSSLKAPSAGRRRSSCSSVGLTLWEARVVARTNGISGEFDSPCAHGAGRSDHPGRRNGSRRTTRFSACHTGPLTPN